MIARVALKELLRTWRVWVGALVTVMAATTGLSAVLLHIGTASVISPEDGRAILSLAYGEFAFLVAATAATAASTTQFAVAETRAGYARMQLSGVLPSQVVIIVVTQLIIVSVLGSLVGVALGIATAQPLLDFTVGPTSIDGQVAVVYAFGPLLIAAATTAGAVVFGGFRAAVAAGATPAVRALQPVLPSPRRAISVGRVLLSILFASIALVLIVTIPTIQISGTDQQMESDLSTVVGLGILLGLALIGVLTALAPALVKIFIGAWTALVPSRVSVSWLVARSAVRRGNDRSAASLGPIMVGIGLPGVLYTVFLTASTPFVTPGGEGASINSAGIAVILGPALVLAALGAATIVFMGATSRRRDLALLAANGATGGISVRIAILESLIYVVSAFVLAMIVMTVVGATVVASLDSTSAQSTTVLGMEAAIIAAVSALLLLMLVTVPSAAWSSRTDVARTLAYAG